jgi:hypothetical protein
MSEPAWSELGLEPASLVLASEPAWAEPGVGVGVEKTMMKRESRRGWWGGRGGCSGRDGCRGRGD